MNERIKNFFLQLPWRNLFLVVLFALCVVSGFIAALLTGNYFLLKRSIINNVREAAQQETERAAKQVDDFLRDSLQPNVSKLVNEIYTEQLPKDQIKDRIKKKPANIDGLGVAFAPYAYDKDIKLYGPYFVDRNGIAQEMQLEGVYDYTQYKRYTQPMQFGPTYIEPFYDPATEAIVVDYGAPMRDAGNNKIGVVFADLTTDRLQTIVQTMSLGYKGYGFLLSRLGAYIAHPLQEYTRQLKTIFDVAKETKNPQLEDMARKAIEGKKGSIEYTSPTGQQAWMFYEPVPTTGWSMIGVFIKDELELNTEELKRKKIQIFLSVMIFLIFLSLLLIRVDTLTPGRLWAGSLLISFFLLWAIVYLWYTAHVNVRYKLEEEDSIVVEDRSTLNRFLETSQQAASAAKSAMVKQADEQTSQQQTLEKAATSKNTEPAPAGLQKEQQPERLAAPTPTNPALNQKVDAVAAEAAPLKTSNRFQKGLQDIVQNLQDAAKSLDKANLPPPPPTWENKEIKLFGPKGVIVQPIPQLTQQYAPQPAAIKVGPSNANQIVQYQFPQQALYQQQQPQQLEEATPQTSRPLAPGEQLHVPTGVYLYNLEFKGINAIKFIGTFWQRYPKDIATEVKRGVIFPLANNVTKTDIYKYDDGQQQVYGWSVTGDVNQQFNYTTYPFDTKIIKIQISPADFDKGIILAADLDAYKIITPSAKPGIDPSVRLDGWYLDRSFFSYTRSKYTTNFGNYLKGPFGIIERSTKSVTPELFFNITLRRYIISSLILDLFPVIVIMLILFVMLFLVSKGLLNQMYQIIGTSTSLFFSVILAHIRFKGNIPVQQIVFFEYFYFILHFLIISVTVICVLYFLQVQNWFIRYQNLLIPQLIYWPTVTIFVLILSLINFY